MYAIRILLLSLIAAIVLLCGCLPIELSVSKDGQILIPRQEGFCSFDPASGAVKKIYVPKSAEPVMGLFSPDDKSILAISRISGQERGGNCAIAVVSVSDGAVREIMKASNLTYARWSPDGRKVALTRIANENKAPIEAHVPELIPAPASEGSKELILVDPASKGSKVLAGNVSRTIRWFPDSKSILSFQMVSKIPGPEGPEMSLGQLIKINIASGKVRLLAKVMGGPGIFDLSPDGKSVLFTGCEAARVGGKLPAKPKDDDPGLFKLDVASGTITKVATDVYYAIYSPKGTKVLILQADEGNNALLKVGGPDLKDVKVIAKDAAIMSVSNGMMTCTAFVPSWFDEKTVLFFSSRAEYGTAVQNIRLISIGADGRGRKDHQTAINTGLAK